MTEANHAFILFVLGCACGYSGSLTAFYLGLRLFDLLRKRR